MEAVSTVKVKRNISQDEYGVCAGVVLELARALHFENSRITKVQRKVVLS